MSFPLDREVVPDAIPAPMSGLAADYAVGAIFLRGKLRPFTEPLHQYGSHCPRENVEVDGPDGSMNGMMHAITMVENSTYQRNVDVWFVLRGMAAPFSRRPVSPFAAKRNRQGREAGLKVDERGREQACEYGELHPAILPHPSPPATQERH